MTSSPTFILDANLPPDLAPVLIAAGASVELHRDHFALGTLDPDWIPIAAERDWFILTKDKKMFTRPAERREIDAGFARVVALEDGNLKKPETIRAFELALPEMTRLATTLPGPFAALLAADGTLTLIFPTQPPSGSISKGPQSPPPADEFPDNDPSPPETPP